MHLTTFIQYLSSRPFFKVKQPSLLSLFIQSSYFREAFNLDINMLKVRHIVRVYMLYKFGIKLFDSWPHQLNW